MCEIANNTQWQKRQDQDYSRNSTPCADRVRIRHHPYKDVDSHHGAANSANDGRAQTEGRERRIGVKHPNGKLANG
jgi:hypothetical protein